MTVAATGDLGIQKFQSRRPGFGLCDCRSHFPKYFPTRFSPVDRDLGFATLAPIALAAMPVGFSPVDRDLGFATSASDAGKAIAYSFQSRRPGFGLCDLSIVRIFEDASVEFQSRRPGFGLCDQVPGKGKATWTKVSVP